MSHAFLTRKRRADYFKLHLIPSDPELWKLKNFDLFVEARKILILDKFRRMLRPSGDMP